MDISALVGYIEQNGLEVVSFNLKLIFLIGNYTIEVERDRLYKLMHEGSVIAPFDDLDDMIDFIKKDMALSDSY